MVAQKVPALESRPYLLYVGHRSGYKNFDRFLEAYAISGLAATHDLHVISPAKQGFSALEQEMLARYNLWNTVSLIPAASEPALRCEYANAHVFVYPSEYEGFGLPVLEAMASGTLVACSNTSSMPEVGGDVALYFDPHRVDSIAAGMKEAVSLAAEERARRIEAGIARAKTFTWERCQQSTIDYINHILSRVV